MEVLPDNWVFQVGKDCTIFDSSEKLLCSSVDLLHTVDKPYTAFTTTPEKLRASALPACLSGLYMGLTALNLRYALQQSMQPIVAVLHLKLRECQ